MTPEEADKAQNWAGMDGVTAYQLIERHADDWHEIGELMNAWLRANVSAAVTDEREACAAACDARYQFIGDHADRAVEGCAAAIRYRNVESC